MSELDKVGNYCNMLDINRFMYKLNIMLDDSEFEHIYWRLFLETRDIERLALGKLVDILHKSERVNEEGYLMQIEEFNFDKMIALA
jgi:hypothetical protein